MVRPRPAVAILVLTAEVTPVTEYADFRHHAHLIQW